MGGPNYAICEKSTSFGALHGGRILKPRVSSEGQRILGFYLYVSPLGRFLSAGQENPNNARLEQLGKVKLEKRVAALSIS